MSLVDTQMPPMIPAPPSDHDAERCLLGGCLHDSVLIDELLLPLPDDAITDAVIRACMLGLQQLRLRGLEPDALALWQHLQQQGTAVSLAVLTDALECTPRNAGLTRYYAERVRESWGRRRFAVLSQQLATAAYRGVPVGDLLHTTQQTMQAVQETTQDQGHVVALGTSAEQVWQSLQRGTVPGIATGFRDLDALLGGWHAGDLSILAGRPGMGKTAVALACACIAQRGIPVFLASLEMGHLQLTQRLLAQQAQVNGQALRLHTVPAADLSRVAAAVATLTTWPLALYDCPGVSIGRLRAVVQTWRARISGPALIIVDYLQLMRPDGSRRDGNRVLEIGEISSGLKHLAREMAVPVLALSQLSRAVESRTSKIPMLSDLRESGNLEQDADNVMFVYREAAYDPTCAQPNMLELHLAKQRNGPLGVVPLWYDDQTQTIRDLTYRQSKEE